MIGVVLYGPPASGKTTVTAAMTELDSRFTLVRKLKVGDTRGSEYEFISADQLTELRAADRLLVETHRYGNIYAIDRHQIEQLTQTGRVPVVHMGSISDIHRLIGAEPWLGVMLWISREECDRRSRTRGDRDTARRLEVWDETAADIAANDDGGVFQLSLATAGVTPSAVAQKILAMIAQAENPHVIPPAAPRH